MATDDEVAAMIRKFNHSTYQYVPGKMGEPRRLVRVAGPKGPTAHHPTANDLADDRSAEGPLMRQADREGD